MSLGFDAISALPFATSGPDSDVAVVVTGNQVSISIVARQNSLCRTSTMTNKINCYSFALEPEEHQPSGTCNFSRIDNAHLKQSGTKHTVETIYAVNYNVLRIMSGMGGLAYSN